MAPTAFLLPLALECRCPRSQTRKGGCFMVWNDVMQLLLVIGGTVGLTFKISWAIFQEIHNNKK
ncbi:hypothetical protein CGS49_03090 [Faecalibacterium langellae]|uniref:Uncharacterized protein n=1 Tax=Faecalibacterium langellae TaxID=3435293 RepID=A0ACC9D204_9FIRM|nr:hypothetical protein CGS49_03090 [Faecalibacterium prausnitzii]